MDLQEELEKLRADIDTLRYSMSIGEWMSLYKNHDLDIHPEFQRCGWSVETKTHFIESILLGIPLSPILVLQRPDGIWEVIDGLQRLFTIFQFMGILKDEEGKLQEPLVLKHPKFLSSLEGKRWGEEGSEDEFENSFNEFQRETMKLIDLPMYLLLESSTKLPDSNLLQLLNND